MNYYFIDYENTGENVLSGIKQLDENSTVIIFYSRNNGIVKAYGTEKRGEIYKKIKPLLKDKKGN